MVSKKPYLFQGVVIPEWASLDFGFSPVVRFGQDTVSMRISIRRSQIFAWVWPEVDCGEPAVYRNLLYSVVRDYLSIAVYCSGHVYDFVITRIADCEGHDTVFGVEEPCLRSHGNAASVHVISRLFHTPQGAFLRRCMNDLASAMKSADDTAFYCYRAIESLATYNAVGMGHYSGELDSQNWQAFRQVVKVDYSEIKATLKEAADKLRHGVPITCSRQEREWQLVFTWTLVKRYLDSQC